MITDEDREELKELTGKIRKTDQPVQWFDYGWNECAEIITEYVNKKRAESAEQARKEAVVRVTAAWMEHGEDITLRMLRAAILGDSAPVSTDSEKLAIAVKALEEIALRDWVENALSPQWAARTASIALKEIQK